MEKVEKRNVTLGQGLTILATLIISLVAWGSAVNRDLAQMQTKQELMERRASEDRQEIQRQLTILLQKFDRIDDKIDKLKPHR
jgi:peptidoglycan hydrolase CwlO-like protein